MNEQLLTQQIDLLRASKTVYETESGNWRPEDTYEALIVQDFEEFIQAGIMHWQQICRIRDSFLEHELKCDKDHNKDYTFIENCVRHFQSKAIAVEKILFKIENDYDVKHSVEFRDALCEANLLTKDFGNLNKTTPLNNQEF